MFLFLYACTLWVHFDNISKQIVLSVFIYCVIYFILYYISQIYYKEGLKIVIFMKYDGQTYGSLAISSRQPKIN